MKYTLVLIIALTTLVSCSSKKQNIVKKIDVAEIGKQIIDSSNQLIEQTNNINNKMLTDDTPPPEARRVFVKKSETTNYIQNQPKEQAQSISLEFENTDLRYIIQLIADASGTNILMDDEVGGKISVSLKNVPWDKALDSILKMKDLGQYIDESANIIRIHKASDIAKIEEYDRKRVENLQKMQEMEQNIKQQHTEIFRIFYANPADIKIQIESILTKNNKNSLVNIVENKRLKSLIITAAKDDLDLIERLLNKLDVKTKQILIEAIIVEVGDEFQKELGSRIGAYANYKGKGSRVIDGTLGGDNPLSNLGIDNSYGGIGVYLGNSAYNLKIELSAMQREGKSKTLSNPKVFTLDTKKAVFKQGTQIPVRGSAENGGTTTTYKDALLKLEVVPTIVGDGNIIMDISLSNDSLHPGSAEIIDAMSIETQLLVKEGTIVVLGGIKKDRTSDVVDKVPGLGDAPIIGNAFKRTADDSGTTELLIFLTTKII
jgi:type IV pilus assembly protein PilQ